MESIDRSIAAGSSAWCVVKKCEKQTKLVQSEPRPGKLEKAAAVAKGAITMAVEPTAASPSSSSSSHFVSSHLPEFNSDGTINESGWFRWSFFGVYLILTVSAFLSLSVNSHSLFYLISSLPQHLSSVLVVSNSFIVCMTNLIRHWNIPHSLNLFNAIINSYDAYYGGGNAGNNGTVNEQETAIQWLEKEYQVKAMWIKDLLMFLKQMSGDAASSASMKSSRTSRPFK